MEEDTAGDPVTGCKWTHKTTQNVAQALQSNGIQVSANTVARLMHEMGYSLRLNLKNLESGGRSLSRNDWRLRDQQFHYIHAQLKEYQAHGLPVISVDTKSRELIGAFHQAGRRWSRKPIEVYDHDFPSDAEGVAIPYGIYDLQRNQGLVCVGTSHDTSQFAVDSIGTWWMQYGMDRYKNAHRLLILADGGGSNGYRNRLWKYQLQTAFCNRFGVDVKVCHYPPGASKWNPIEHRMFCFISFISNNWAAVPLKDYETVLNYIQTTKTAQGLCIQAYLNTNDYPKGIKVTKEQMDQVCIKTYTSRPDWNYSILST
jgi:hypothetical protein